MNPFRAIRRSSALAVSLLVAMVAASGCSSSEEGAVQSPAAASNPNIDAKVTSEVRTALKTEGRTRVIVTLAEPQSPAGLPLLDTLGKVLKIDEIRKGVLDKIVNLGTSVQITHTWKHISGFSAEVDQAGLEALAADPKVEHVQVDEVVSINLTQSLALIKADKAQASGYKGKGQKVVVIDTGVAADHPSLSGKVVAEACFCSGQFGQACCPNGTSEQTGPGSSKDDQGHGSHVSGIVAGVAPEATLGSVKVLDSNGYGQTSGIVSALDWVYDNHPDAAAVNMSLGGGTRSSGDCGASNTAYRDAINNLRSKGVLTVAASGNDASSTGISPPACVGAALSVGAVYDANVGRMAWSNCTDSTTAADKITCFSNSAANLDVLAPGSPITSVNYQGGTASMSGTSQATPHVAGAVAVLKAANTALTPDDIESILKSTGISLTDSRNSVTKPRIDVEAAAAEAARRATPQ